MLGITLRTKIELSAVLVFVFGMLVFGFSCAPGECHLALRQWLMTWWAGTGLFALYFVWTRLK